MTDTHAGPATAGAAVVDSCRVRPALPGPRRHPAGRPAGRRAAPRSPATPSDFGAVRPWGADAASGSRRHRRRRRGDQRRRHRVGRRAVHRRVAAGPSSSAPATPVRARRCTRRSSSPATPTASMTHVYDIDDNADVPDGAIVESLDAPRDRPGRRPTSTTRSPTNLDRVHRRRAARRRRRAAHVPADPRAGRPAQGRPGPVRPRDQRGGRRAAALARRRQLHDPRPRRVLGQRAGQPAGPQPTTTTPRACCAARPASPRSNCCRPSAAAPRW